MRAPVLLLLLSLPAAAQECERIFETPARYLSGRARDLVTADLDADGRADLLVARDGHGLTRLLNREDGFVIGTPIALPANAIRLFDDGAHVIAAGESDLATITGDTIVVTAMDGKASAAAMADVDGDGRADLAFAGRFIAGVAYGNGDGTFGEPRTLAYAANSVATGDFDEDGRADVLLDSQIFLTSRSLAAAAHAIASPLSRRTVADVDGDGHLDVLSGSLLYRGRVSRRAALRSATW